jgi:hypothetical protein
VLKTAARDAIRAGAYGAVCGTSYKDPARILDWQVISGEVAADLVFARGRKFELGPVAMR